MPAADPALLSFSVHAMPTPGAAGRASRRTTLGRLQMLVVLLACAAPVVASYFTYFVVRPQGRSNYSDLVLPPRSIPAGLALRDLSGRSIAVESLRGQWLLVVVGGGACDASCERQLVLQRQLHTSIGAERDRVDKLWLVDDAAQPRAETLRAIRSEGAGDRTEGRAGERDGVPSIDATAVLLADRDALAEWLRPADGTAIGSHLYIVDPRGDYMMRAPSSPDPSRLKRDLDRLLRASASWDPAGRQP